KGRRRTIRKTTPLALTMPSEFKAQNGASFKQSTRIAVQGCAKGKAGKGKKAKKGKGGKHKK
ncbi:MAG TPA: hypothetical protein VFU90_05245, partial [Candidatus Tumulicola sp.]|nr:hypothetical protein [Candidatus Tumulicola sp.]